MNCSLLTWLTVAPTHIIRPQIVNQFICAKHLTVFTQSNFWRNKWIAVRQYIIDNPNTNMVLVTDLSDVYMSPEWTTERVLFQFHRIVAMRAPLMH